MRIAAICLVIFIHAVLIGATAMSVPRLILEQPPYVSLPMVLIITRILYSRDGVCPLNDLENVLRRQAGLPETEGFMKHYIYGRLSRKAT